MAMPRLEEAILWRRLDTVGHDACGLWAAGDDWLLAGTAVFRSGGIPCCLGYEVECTSAWQTRSASVSGWLGKTQVRLAISVTPSGDWIVNGRQGGDELAGLVDLDLGFTPATNLVQVRRLSLEVGRGAEIFTVYLHFPELYLGRLRQAYRRIAENSYEYSAPAFGYSGTLQVSGVGFVTLYPGLWAVEASAGGSNVPP